MRAGTASTFSDSERCILQFSPSGRRRTFEFHDEILSSVGLHMGIYCKKVLSCPIKER